MAQDSQTVVRWLREFFPAGTSLSEQEWAVRHRILIVLVGLHAVGLPILGWAWGATLLQGLLTGAVIGACAFGASLSCCARRTRSAVAGFGMALSSSALVHLSGGYIESHFHYFVVLPLLMLYQDWIPFVIAALFVGLHHSVVGTLFPHSVYNHPAALAQPWLWSGVHVLFFSAASVVYVYTWRHIERTLVSLRESEERVRQSEMFLESIIEHLPSLVFVKEAVELRHVQFNAACERLLGVSKKDVLGKNNYDLFHKEDADRYTANDREVLASGRMLDIPEEIIHTATKGERLLHTTKVPICDTDGTPRFLLGISEDVTDRRMAEASVRESEARFRQVVESAPNGMLMVRRDGRITLVNAQVERLFGYSREELVGQSVDVLVPQAFRAHHQENVQKYFAQPSMRAMGANRDLFGLRKDGTELPIEIGLMPLETPEGPQVIASIIDITERKQAEETLRAHDALLAAANKELEAFAYSVSHDLRAPLRGIDGFSQALLEDYQDKLDAQGQDYLRRVRGASQRMGQLIDDLLNLSRLTRKEFHRELVDLRAQADAVFTVLRQADPERQVECVVAPVPPASGDAGLLRIVLENLLGNAWKFTAKRTQAKIEFGATTDAGGTTYFVRDNGAGLDMAYADKLFAPFQRLHGMTEFPGTGIGLATVSRIVHRHGGRVWIDGAVGQGVTVFFTLV